MGDKQEARLTRAVAKLSDKDRKRFAELKAEWDAMPPEERAERTRKQPVEVIYGKLHEQWESPKDTMFALTIMEFADEVVEALTAAGYSIMKLNIPKEWCIEAATREGDAEVGAGFESIPIPRCLTCGAPGLEHDHKPDNSGLDDGPYLPGHAPRKAMGAKTPEEKRATRTRAWATRRKKYGPHGHR